MPNSSPSDRAQTTFLGLSPERMPMLVVLLVAACLTPMTGGAIAPVFPDMVDQLQLDDRWAGLLISVPKLTVAIAAPILGLLADRTGKLRILVFSLVGFAVFGTFGGLLNAFVPLLASRALVGVANGGISAASLGLVASWFEGETRARLIGYTASLLAIASTIFPLAAGGLGAMGWQYAFLLYGLALPIAVAAARIVVEPKVETDSSGEIGSLQLSSLVRDLRQPGFLIVLLSLACSSAVFYTVIAYAPDYFKDAIGASAPVNGIILATRAIGAAIIAAIGANQVAKRIGATGAIALGFGFMSATVATIPVIDSVRLALVAAFGFGIGFGLVMPNLYTVLANLVSVEHRSTLLALGTGCSSLGQFFAPILLGGIWERGHTDVFLVAAGMAIAIAVLQIASTKFHR